MELCPPFDGWHLDVDGIIHTPAGYRCTPQQIEAALWLAGMLRYDMAKRPIFADSALEPRRPLSEARDWSVNLDRLRTIGRRGYCTTCQTNHQDYER